MLAIATGNCDVTNVTYNENEEVLCRHVNCLSRVEMARAANNPVFGPSATVLKQSASNFFSDDVTQGRYGPLQSARQNFLFFAKVS